MTRLRLILVISMLVLLAPFMSSRFAPSAHAYSNSNMMDNPVFDNVGSMSESQIQAFLAAKGPCLANAQEVDFNWNGSTWTYGPGTIPASRMIFKSAQQWGLNPQVIIATLQKEESLITGTSCDQWRYDSAMGYGCPDSGGCNPKYVGLSKQILWGSWQLKFNKERSEGNLAWDGDGDITYVGFMTQGSYKRCNACSAATYNGNATIDGQLLHLENGTTASLYTYTPHLNQSFPGIFESYFGAGSTSAYPLNVVFRSANPRTGEHFMTLDPNEWNYTVKYGFIREGISFTQSTTSSKVPVTRLIKPDGKHFYTASSVEAQDAAAHYGFKQEGAAFFVDPTGASGGQPVYRLRSPRNNDHLYTINIAERDYASTHGYILEGIAWYGF
jgi:hypothetical protein